MGFDEEAGSSSHTLPTFPREDTPLVVKPRKLSSQCKTFANVLISVVGAGVLGLPYAFKKTGWVMGLLMLFSVAAVTYYCMMLLVYTRRRLDDAHGFSKILSFGDLGFSVCGPVGRFAVDAMIVLSQSGFCISYLMFISTTLAYVFNRDDTSTILDMSPSSVYLWGCFPVQLGLNSIPTLTLLAPLSILADIVNMGAMGVAMVKEFTRLLERRTALRAFGGFSVFLYGLGVAVYSFEGIGMVLPLESETKDKDKFGKILGLSMGAITVMFGAFGVLGYSAFGEDTRAIITTNLGPGLLSCLVQLGLCINLSVTFPLMMNPVFEVFERRFCRSRYCLWLRWMVVLAVSLVALFIPNFADFLSLVGSSICCVLAFVLPTLFHLIVFARELSWKRRAVDGSILALGVLVAVSGTWISLSEIFAASKG